MGEPLVVEPFCEVPHMARAHIEIIKRQGWGEVVLAPFTGWDYIEEFLKAGLTVYIFPRTPLFLTYEQYRWIVNRYRRRARKNYGPGRLRLGLPKRELYGHEGHGHRVCQR